MTTTSTPSPSASGSAGQPPSTSASSSRRPPRKSTLTQQQKNQKRQRATQEQLLTLEMEFNKNPTPTAIVRERIAQEINMTERSVQIWFQNRRAKIKNIAKKSIESGEDCNDIPESMRRYLALQAMESGKTLGRDFMGRTSGMPYGSGMLLNTETSSSKVVIHHFACRSLSIGTWRRVGQSAMDLVIFYSPEKCCVTYYINNDSAGYKIEYPFAYIKNISLELGDGQNAEGASQRPGGLVVELTRPPNFFMDSSGSGGFYQCGDFTEDQQASQVLVHHLGGHPKVLSGQLAKLVSLESFQNRHNFYDPNALAMSAPVSPINHRPASQPNQFVHPSAAPMYHESPFEMPGGLQPPPAHRGHKRQRSRSVPVAMDFSMLRQNPMQPFMIPPPPQTSYPAPPYTPQPQEIYAPVPQHNMSGPIGPNLSIDTSAGYGMDFRQYPMSATTANSPSDYGTPGFFTSNPGPDNMPAANFSTPYSNPYLSPLPDQSSIPHQSMSPMSAISHGDPIIANQSPPLTSLGRASSADLYPMSQDSAISDDGMSLSEMYAKQSLSLPFRSPMGDDNLEDLDMSNLVSFGTIDPSSLSPEQHQQHHQQTM
ncbi:putative homeobox domain-containing protein [Lasiodiplodia theobromae]|uniref:Homeobox domain-containing protein n=2 Tax=Lasiodiplodia TaxID=66739 RepID=A0A5N5DTN6_9PEZI|nr:Homeobox domain-containing protein [Lasiodiplodia theobromae]KAB2581117.1 Homeobox protein HOY1 [Lasiodiplodia theobromae]KAF4539981.1 Homeobox domain-containing protein [Lasiodiplodia theobromae]KAF9629406.1 putative homeobox domain-containing protein [Lasiodiplodia theobromae]KAK0664253.1 Homeobox protein HOY1 [Lasiodiplodia hormozganensis]